MKTIIPYDEPQVHIGTAEEIKWLVDSVVDCGFTILENESIKPEEIVDGCGVTDPNGGKEFALYSPEQLESYFGYLSPAETVKREFELEDALLEAFRKRKSWEEYSRRYEEIKMSRRFYPLWNKRYTEGW